MWEYLERNLKADVNILVLLVYLNGNNAAEGENNIKYANSQNS